MILKEYKIAVYSGQDRPGDTKQVEQFVIHPQKPWFSEAEQKVARRALRLGPQGILGYWVIIRYKGIPVASGWLHLSGDCHRTGLMGYVLTDDKHRRKGLGREVCQTLLKIAEKAGCQIILLGTGNPAAKKLYEQVGFSQWYGISMCWPVAAYEKQTVPYGDAETIITASWSNLGSIVRFVLEPQEQTVVDYFEGLSRKEGFISQKRTASIGVTLLLRAEQPGNAMWLLVNSNNQVQGLANIIGRQDNEAKNFLQLCVHQKCRDGGTKLARQAIDFAVTKGDKNLLAVTGKNDHTHISCLKSCGFEPFRDETCDNSIEKWILKL